MGRFIAIALLLQAFSALAAAAPNRPAPAARPLPTGPFQDATGLWSNTSNPGPIDPANPFFQPLGTNGRSCASCHAVDDAWAATPGKLQQRFRASGGTDPVFASVDGTNCPSLDVQTPSAHASASSLLLSKGLIRVEMAVAADAEFAVSAVDNPYGCSSLTQVSVYRRIPMSANLRFLTEVMWDGRESTAGNDVAADLRQQIADAITQHAQAQQLPAAAVIEAIAALETAQSTAQSADNQAGSLSAAGARGGPAWLAQQAFTPGANAPFPGNGVPPQPVFTLFDAWTNLTGADAQSRARAAIARGQQLFNTRPLVMRDVAGLNDTLGADRLPRTTVTGTCGTCHNTPNVGSSSSAVNFRTGTAGAGRRSADLPLFTLINKRTGQTVQVSDPGRALVSGKWADVGRFKVPALRGLAARAPFFHDGSAANLGEVVGFYDRRFGMNLSPQERADLIAFLRAL